MKMIALINSDYQSFENIMSVAEVARHYKLKRRTVQRYCESGTLTAIKMSGCREWIISKQSVIRELGLYRPNDRQAVDLAP